MELTVASKQLKSLDPKQRYQAIKAIARAKDMSMIGTLAQIAKNDPDEQVRSVAAKAQAYIQSADTPSADEKVPPRDSGPSGAREVSREDEVRAKDYISQGLSYQSKGERNKALKALAKAVQLNPNIRSDTFFVSVLEATTSLSGDAALAMLHDKTELKNIQVTEKQLKKEQRAEDHWATVEKSTWQTALMDLAIYTCVIIAGTILAVMVLGQSADGVITGYNASIDAYWAAVDAGEKEVKPPEEVNPAFWAQAEELRVIGLPTAVIVALALGVGNLVGLVIHLVMTHLAARFVFKGKGTLPHLIYKVVSTYNANLPIIFGLIIVGIILTYSSGSNTPGAIFGAILSLYSLKLSFQTLGKVSQTYDFGMAKGCMSVVVGSIVVGILGGIAQFVLLATVTELVVNSMA